MSDLILMSPSRKFNVASNLCHRELCFPLDALHHRSLTGVVWCQLGAVLDRRIIFQFVLHEYGCI